MEEPGRIKERVERVIAVSKLAFWGGRPEGVSQVGTSQQSQRRHAIRRRERTILMETSHGKIQDAG